MAENPLLGKSEDTAEKKTRAEHTVNLVSNKAAGSITGLEDFLAAFNTPEVEAVILPFRHTVQRKVRRQMGGKFSQGITQEVVETLEINPNEDLVALRRWMGAIRQDPANVMLLQMGKVKDEPLAAPLVFSEQIKAGRPILVTGADQSAIEQLLTKPDLAFKEVPERVEENHSLKTMFLARSQRKKGFMATMRNLMELDIFPQELAAKITEISTGADAGHLTPAESINLGLLSDLVSRYQPIFRQYKESFSNGTLQVAQLRTLFEMLCADIPTDRLVAAFRHMLDPEKTDPGKVTGKGALFAGIYQYISGEEAKKDKSNRKEVFFKKLFDLIIQHRAVIDPKLWGRVHFLSTADPTEKALYQGLIPYFKLLAQTLDNHQGRPEETPVDGPVKDQTARQLFGLILLANQDPARMSRPEEFARHRLTNQLLKQFSLTHFPTSRFVWHGKANPELPSKPEPFINGFKKIPLLAKDIGQLATRLKPLLFYNQMVTEEVRKATFNVMVSHQKEQEKDLVKLFTFSLVETLPFVPLHLAGGNGMIKRCGPAALKSLLDLEAATTPLRDSLSILEDEASAALTGLATPPHELARAYQTLLNRRVEKVVRQYVERKMNHLSIRYGDGVFEAIYRYLAYQRAITLSRAQFVAVMREVGPLKKLDESRFDPEKLHLNHDPFLPVAHPPEETAEGEAKPADLYAPYAAFGGHYQRAFVRLESYLADCRQSAQDDPEPLAPHRLLWQLFSKGMMDFTRPEALGEMAASPHYMAWKDFLGRIFQDNPSNFGQPASNPCLWLKLPPRLAPLLALGRSFSYLDVDKQSVYRLELMEEGDLLEEGDEENRLFGELVEAAFSGSGRTPQLHSLAALNLELGRYQEIWRDYSRALAVALLDRAWRRRAEEELNPPPPMANHLWYLPDESKLCLGKAIRAAESVPFTRILRSPDRIGNVAKSPRVLSMTIDEFTVESYRTAKLKEELKYYRGVCEDMLEAADSLNYLQSEAPLVRGYRDSLAAMLRILSLPLKEMSEVEVATLDKLANGIKQLVQKMMEGGGAAKNKFVFRLSDAITAMRADGQKIKPSFTDIFILPRADGSGAQSLEAGGHQTLPLQLKHFVGLKGVLSSRNYIVLEPDGQRRKPVEYTLHILDTFLRIRGAGVRFYLDNSGVTADYAPMLATRVSPANNYHGGQLTPEPPPGMKVTTSGVNPVTGMPLSVEVTQEFTAKKPAAQAAQSSPAPAKPAAPQAARPGGALAASSPPARPQAAAATTAVANLFSSADGKVRFRYDGGQKRFFLQTAQGEVLSTPLPVEVGPAKAYVLITRLPSSKLVFHCLFNKQVSSPQPQKPEPPGLCRFELAGRGLLVSNQGGKPVARLE